MTTIKSPVSLGLSQSVPIMSSRLAWTKTDVSPTSLIGTVLSSELRGTAALETCQAILPTSNGHG